MRVFTAAAVVLWSITAVAWAQVGSHSSGATGDGSAVGASPSSTGAAASGSTAAPAATPSTETAAATRTESAAQSPDGTGNSRDSLSAIEQAFQSADLAGKLSILHNEASKPSRSMGPLYQMALDYLTANLPVLHSQPEAQDLAVIASRLIGSTGYAKAAESAWQLFQLSDADTVRLAAANALAVVAKGNADVINKMNHWLAAQNLLHATGSSVDSRVVDGCVRALAALADPSSFEVLFATLEAGYGQQITNDARNGLGLLKGDRAKQFVQVVTNGRYSVRTAALRMAIGDGRLTTAQKAAVAMAALEGELSIAEAARRDASRSLELRFTAVEYLGKLQWSPAAGLILKNFNRAAAEYRTGAIPAIDVVRSADALSAMATHEAAVRLSLYLGLINSMKEKGRPFDRRITLAVVQGLGRLGDSVAYENLSAMQYLDYPHSVKEAAARAVDNLTIS